jgi:hypothetical protein
VLAAELGDRAGLRVKQLLEVVEADVEVGSGVEGVAVAIVCCSGTTTRRTTPR